MAVCTFLGWNVLELIPRFRIIVLRWRSCILVIINDEIRLEAQELNIPS